MFIGDSSAVVFSEAISTAIITVRIGANICPSSAAVVFARTRMALSVPDCVKRAPSLSFAESNPIQRAIYCGSTRTLRYLLRLGSNPNIRSGQLRQTPLMLVCYVPDRAKRCVMTDLLLANGADETLVDRNRWNSLFYACALGKADVASRLIENAKVELTPVDKEGNTVLHICAMEGHSVILLLLLKEMRLCGSSINLYNNMGMTPLVVAISQGQPECATLLHSAGGFPKLSENDFTCLISMSYSYPDFARELLHSMMPAGSKLTEFRRNSSLQGSEKNSRVTMPELAFNWSSDQETSASDHSLASHDTGGSQDNLHHLPELRHRSQYEQQPDTHPNQLANKRTYPCNQIITGVSRKYGNTYRISDRIPQVRPQVPISAAWVGAVQQYSHLPSLPTKHQPAVSPTTLPSMPSRAMTTAAMQVPFPLKSMCLLSRKSEFFGNKLPSLRRRRGSRT